MGLAASQARLLTLTSRLSSIELRQQAIANSKILLANDSEEVSNKYTKALNNQTLKMSDGTNELAMNYSNLKSFGYDVRRTGDGVMAKSGKYTGEVVAKPTCKRPEEIEKPAILEKPLGTKTTTTEGSGEVKGIFDYVYDIISSIRNINYWKTDSGTSIDVKDMTNAEKKAAGVTTTDYWSSIKKKKEEWTSTAVPAFDRAIAQLKSAGKSDLAEKLTYQKTSKTQSINEERSEPKSTYDSGMSSYNAINRHMTVCTNAMFNSKDEYNSVTISANDGSTITEAVYTPEQQAVYDNWQKEVKQAEQQWTAYDNYVKTSSEATGVSGSSVDLYNQLSSNPQFLIQGLLSGYLTLVKDGQDVSISSATNVLEQYDKSDDAAAEAEYNAQMAKINRKEKMLDQQMKNLDTEHSAMQQEVESIKSIIKNHAEKDFNLFG